MKQLAGARAYTNIVNKALIDIYRYSHGIDEAMRIYTLGDTYSYFYPKMYGTSFVLLFFLKDGVIARRTLGHYQAVNIVSVEDGAGTIAFSESTSYHQIGDLYVTAVQVDLVTSRFEKVKVTASLGDASNPIARIYYQVVNGIRNIEPEYFANGANFPEINETINKMINPVTSLNQFYNIKRGISDVKNVNKNCRNTYFSFTLVDDTTDTYLIYTDDESKIIKETETSELVNYLFFNYTAGEPTTIIIKGNKRNFIVKNLSDVYNQINNNSMQFYQHATSEFIHSQKYNEEPITNRHLNELIKTSLRDYYKYSLDSGTKYSISLASADIVTTDFRFTIKENIVFWTGRYGLFGDEYTYQDIHD